MTRLANGPFAPPRDWDALKRAYEQHTGPLEQLAEANNIKLTTLQGYASKFKWARPAGVMTTAGGIAAIRSDIVLRLFAAVSRKLSQLEASMETTDPLSTADHERQSRTIGSLATNLEKVDDLSRADAGTGGQSAAGKPAVAPETAGNDEDKLRRELAARIERLRERLAR